eukprot:PLAT3175.3.p1 GENE.PLAT3175.3~~PLAT3175.3.p1  ORF type:complete len:458 (+),score=176.18 PLAT3175.3:39-1412(+)
MAEELSAEAAAARTAAIAADLAWVSDNVPSVEVETSCDSLVSIRCRPTPYRGAIMRLQFPVDYPTSPLLIEVSSKTYCEEVISKLVSMGDRTAGELAGSPQMGAVLDKFRKKVHSDLFLYAWEEKNAVKELAELEEGQFQSNAKAGAMLLSLKHGSYRLKVKLTVPASYPEDEVQVELGRTNLPEYLKNMLDAQVVQVMRKLRLGQDFETAVETTLKRMAPGTKRKKEEEEKEREVRLGSDTVLDMKHDVRFLTHAADLREFNAAKSHGMHEHSTKERKAARRRLARLARSEARAEVAAEAEEKRVEAMMEEAMAPEERAPATLQPIVTFIVRHGLHRLLSEKCQQCSLIIFPSAAATTKRLFDGSKPPQRVLCGHWFHYKCLRPLLTKPPFRATCQSCDGEEVYHQKWSKDIARLQKRWAKGEMKRRELEDISDFLDVGEEFTRHDEDDVYGFGEL